jgi:hypothetical protein
MRHVWIVVLLVACSGGSSAAPPPGGGESIERPAPPPDAGPAPAPVTDAAVAVVNPGCTPACTPAQYCIEMTVTGGKAPPRGQPASVSIHRYCSDQLPASGGVHCTPPDGDRVVRCRGYAP